MKRKWFRFSVFLWCVVGMAQSVSAAERLTVSHNMVRDNELYVYIENPGDFDEITCQVGQAYVEDVSVKELSDPELTVDTYILIDNSLSIQEKYRETLKQVAKDIIFAGKENENFTIATFDTEIHYLIENSSSSEELIQTVDQIAFQDLDTQVIDVLYHLYDEKIENDDENFKRVILMSDGMETQTIGYTREELMSKVKENAYPVYVLGCTYKSNETELENLFRISRETNATYYFLDTVDSADQVAAGISDSFDMIRVQVTIPEGQRDGSVKGIKIVFKTGEEEKSVSFSQQMPFYTEQETEDTSEGISEGISEGVSENVSEVISEGVSEDISEDAVGSAAESERYAGTEAPEITDEDTPNLAIVRVLVPVIVILAVIVLAAVIVHRRKKAGNKGGRKTVNEEDEHTEFLEDGKTELIGDEDDTGMVDFINIRLADTSRPSRVVEFSLVSALTIGRVPGKCQVVFDYEKSISSQHCEIYRVENKVFIRDLHSSNRTLVDGIVVEEPVELTNGAIIKLGRLQLEFQIM